VIIPAYNEEATVGEVVAAARLGDSVGEVIVVSDGSSDGTAAIARAGGARVVELEQNRGKAAAMKVGLLAASFEIILFLDADLIGLRPDHVKRLLDPILAGQADVAIGIMRRGRAATDLAQVVTPFLSGVRAGRAEVFQTLRDLDENAGWGAELALTLWARENKCRIEEVRIYGVTQRMKEEKVGLARGLWARMRMYWDILRVMPRSERMRR
jgi:glycosyltransferase involved in cell wall biosynthesis